MNKNYLFFFSILIVQIIKRSFFKKILKKKKALLLCYNLVKTRKFKVYQNNHEKSGNLVKIISTREFNKVSE